MDKCPVIPTKCPRHSREVIRHSREGGNLLGTQQTLLKPLFKIELSYTKEVPSFDGMTELDGVTELDGMTRYDGMMGFDAMAEFVLKRTALRRRGINGYIAKLEFHLS